MATVTMARIPSPSKQNPFARPVVEPTIFTRATLLPAHSPAKARPEGPSASGANTLAAKVVPASTTPNTRTRPAWRLLWRGGFEIGPGGWRLDGITFVAHLSFPTGTPSNAFASPVPSAFAPQNEGLALPANDTDLCLSLESMRGRKYLQLRDVIPLTDDDIDVDDSGVQMSITSPILASFFTGLLCRSARLSPQGKTTTGVVVGLGDEGVDRTSSSVIIYGQRQSDTEEPTLRLCVGRRRVQPRPSEQKVRPGEPLPRAPLQFPAKAPVRPPPPIPHRSMSRALSVPSIYAPPQVPLRGTSTDNIPHGSGRTPGRRGDKRPRLEEGDDLNRKKRKAGRIVPERLKIDDRPWSAISANEDEDIFGSRSASVVSRAPSAVPRSASVASRPEILEPMEGSSSKVKRTRVPQMVLDNKAIIRKQTLHMLEARGYPREHDLFKDVFGMATKGVYFALRHAMETAALDKAVVQDLVGRHLDMYLPLERIQLPLSQAIRSNTPETSVVVKTEVDERAMRTPSP